MFKKIIKLNKDKCSGNYLSLFDEKIDVYFFNEWHQFKGKWNWITFRFLQIELEKDIHCGQGSFEFVLLGLGFRLQWQWGEMDKELEKTLNESIKDIKIMGWEMDEIRKIFNLPKDMKGEDVIKFLKDKKL